MGSKTCCRRNRVSDAVNNIIYHTFGVFLCANALTPLSTLIYHTIKANINKEN